MQNKFENRRRRTRKELDGNRVPKVLEFFVNPRSWKIIRKFRYRKEKGMEIIPKPIREIVHVFAQRNKEFPIRSKSILSYIPTCRGHFRNAAENT